MVFISTGNGQMVPPKFDLSLITNQHIALFYSKNDYVADYQDVLWTKEQLKVTPMVDYVIPDERWNHFDYVWANDLGDNLSEFSCLLAD